MFFFLASAASTTLHTVMALAPVVLPAVGAALTLVPAVFRLVGRLGKSLTIAAIEERQEAERAREEAEQVVREAQDRVDRVRREAEQECHRARARQEEADRAAVQAAEEVERWSVQLEEELARAASKAAQDVATAFAGEVQGGQEQSLKIEVDVERVMAAAREEAKKAQKAADNQRIVVDVSEALADEMVRAAVEEAQKANKAKVEAERRLKESIQPVITPTPEELAVAKQHIQYEEGRCHVAIAGISGSGKSSLVNAFRGLHSKDPRAAATGVTETTLRLARYPDTNSDRPLVWYDIPGAGTLQCPDWRYFNDQGLYVFDSIIVLFDNRFTMTDIAILTNARRFNIPTYIVRSKADQHIQNIMMMDMGYENEGNDKDVKRCNQLCRDARKQFIEETKKTVRSNLEVANLPDQRVYIISSNTLLRIMSNKMPRDAVDEADLLNDVFGEIYKRRKAHVV